MQIKSIKGVGISSGSNKYEHDDAMEEKTMNVFCDFFLLFSSMLLRCRFRRLLTRLTLVHFIYIFIFFIIYEKAVFMIVWALIFIIST